LGDEGLDTELGCQDEVRELFAQFWVLGELLEVG